MVDALATLTRKVLFSPLAEPGRTETVATRIRSAIMLGIYIDGEQLPNEIELAAQFNISPVTLRDALKVMRSEGLVRTTRGRSGGTFVISPDESNMEPFEQALTQIPTLALRDLLDEQSALLSYAARLAAERISLRDINTLSKSVATLETRTTALRCRRAISRFLIELASASRSARISKALIALQIEVAPHIMLVMRDHGNQESAAEQIEAIIDSLKLRDGEVATEKTLGFLDSISNQVLHLHHRLTHPRSNEVAKGSDDFQQ